MRVCPVLNTTPSASNTFLANAEKAPPELLTVLSFKLQTAKTFGFVAFVIIGVFKTGHTLIQSPHSTHLLPFMCGKIKPSASSAITIAL
jgi:hypothetical protein